MPWLFINTFHGGINTDTARVKRNQALKMQNLDISKTGFMKKRLGYTDLGLAGTPSQMKTIYEWSNNVATNQNMVVETHPNFGDRLHQSSDGASFIILDNQLGNFVERKTGNYLPFPKTVGSLAVLDQFFSASADTSADSITPSGIASLGTTNDIYNNWILHNIKRTTTRIITDYIGANGIFKLNSSIPNQSSLDLFYITKNDWDKVHVYSEKNGVLRGGVGNASQNIPFWLGYINGASFFNGLYSVTDYIFTNNRISRGDSATTVEMPWPGSPIRLGGSTKPLIAGASNFLETAISYYYQFSLVYDDLQEGFLTSVAHGAGSVAVSENINLNISAFAVMNPRIRQMNLYRGTTSDGVFNYIDTISMNQSSWVLGAVHRYNMSYLDTNMVVGDSFGDRTGLNPTINQPLRNYNYKYEVQIAERRFIAGVSEEILSGDINYSDGYTKTIRDYPNRVYWSHITPQLVICPDIFLQNNWMTFGEGGDDTITGISRVLNNLIVFLENTTFVVRMSSGNVLTWEKQETIAGIGCVAPESIVDAGGRIIFAGRDNIYLFNLTAPVPLLDDKIEQDYQAIANKSNGRAVYYPKRRQYWITFSEVETTINNTSNANITYVIDLKTGAVHKHHSERASLTYAVGVDGELFRTDGTIIMQDDDSSMTETIGIGYRSVMIDAGTPQDKIWEKILLHYQSDDDIKVRIYLRRKDQGRFGTSVKTITFPAKPGSMTTKIIDLNEKAEALQIEIFSANSANTTVKIGQIGLKHEQLETTAT